jgi:hypothetical protein
MAALPERARGRRRAEIAEQLAQRCRDEHATITIAGLAADVGRRTCSVRELLTEAGFRSRRLLIGLDHREVTAELVRRFQAGTSVEQLRAVTGLNEKMIRARLRYAGVTLGKHGNRHDLAPLVPELVERYEAGGESIDALAAAIGASFGTVRRVLLDAGVQLRLPGRPPRSRQR